MVAFGSKALHSRKPKIHNLTEDTWMAGEDNSYRKKKMGRRARDKGADAEAGGHIEQHGNANPHKSSRHHDAPALQSPSHLRKQVDPETAKYFTEIANVLEGGEVSFEEHSVICGSALEETRGKEVEIATDYVMSHTLQTLLEGCDVDHLCVFLQRCTQDFPCISMDRSGSHVAETALKSLFFHLQSDEAHLVIEETLTMICKVLGDNPIDVMCNCYGSHVLRSLLCLCKGLPLDSSEFHANKSSAVLAQRLNFKASHPNGSNSPHLQQGFPALLKFLVSKMFRSAGKGIMNLRINQYSSLVLQAALKVSVGHDEDLLHIIPTLLGCDMENIMRGSFIEIGLVPDIRDSLKDTAYSHLMEVILEVAPETLYNELFTKVFRKSLFDISSHHCGNFAVQALISHAKSKDQMELIWEELGAKFRDLFELGRSGVIASLIASSQRLHTHEHKCCEALAAAICMENDLPKCIVPRILFLESYFFCEDKSNWVWPNGVKMHVMGSLILQSVFRFPSEFIQPYIASITSMEAEHVLQALKEAGGARVVEAFLNSDASEKHKCKLVRRLQGHFGEISMNSSGSFTVEKCFTYSNASLREGIVSELSVIQSELSKTKQGPYLLRKLDVHGFATRPDQWRSTQVSKQSAYEDFSILFGSNKSSSSKKEGFLAEASHKLPPDNIKKMRMEIDKSLSSANQSLGKLAKHAMEDDVSKLTGRKQKKKKHGGTEKADDANNQKPFVSIIEKKEKKRNRKDSDSKSFSKKLKK